jgi:predicted RNase H-like nuclease (RuvC/YqgF family)
MDENNKLIASLSQQVADKDSRIKKYESTVKDLKTRITKYQSDMDALLVEKEALQYNLNEATAANNRLTARVDTLGNEIVYISNELENQKQVNIQKENDLNTAYVAVGHYKELRDKNVIQKEGGFLGINKVTTLKGNPNEEVFNEIDIREATVIPVSAKRWQIVTGQDPSSYDLNIVEDRLESIKITDPQKFWKKSKYLVVVIRDKDSDDLASSR